MPAADPRLIVPLDVPTAADARAMVARLGEAVSFYKVGLELFATDGMALAKALATTRYFKGVTGTITIDKDRNAKKSMVILQMKGGKPIYVATVEPPAEK